jgi:membrane fusion protein (multidrug efflux system)
MAELVDLDATAQSDLDNAKTQWAISKAKLEEVRARLERTKIVAPGGGVLNDLLVEEGEYVQPGMPVAEIVDTSVVKVVVDVPERDIGFFKVGQKAEVIVDSKVADSNGQPPALSGPITFISELADARTRSTPVEITLANPERELRSGQIVRVRLTRRMLKDAVLIPLLAVIPMEEGYAAYVVNSDEAHRRDLKLGIMRKDEVQVEQGLKAGDQLIVAGHRFVAPGQKVRIIPETK